MMNAATRQYEALQAGVGYADVSDWTEIEVSGADRLKFLNNFCTADLRKLSPGGVAEALICNVKGKVLGHVYIYCDENVLVIETVPDQVDVLLPHLDRYTLSDDATLRDITGKFMILFVGGPQAESCLRSLADTSLPTASMSFIECRLGGQRCAIARGTMFSPDSFSLCLSPDDGPQVAGLLRNAGAVECDAAALEAFRIEAGMPLYGRDITDDNLPQEVNRNAQAISLTKGCYLGQETVARIDALGHVNRLLVGVQFFGDRVPAVGDELSVEGKPMGHVMSATYSPRLSRPLALAYVRTANAEPGQRLTSAVGEAEVIALPVT